MFSGPPVLSPPCWAVPTLHKGNSQWGGPAAEILGKSPFILLNLQSIERKMAVGEGAKDLAKSNDSLSPTGGLWLSEATLGFRLCEALHPRARAHT